MADHRGISVVRIALALLLAQRHVTSVVIDAKRMGQLKTILAPRMSASGRNRPDADFTPRLSGAMDRLAQV